jgi:hypothetical protein
LRMSFADDQDMIQTVAPERPDQALSTWVLPGTHRPNARVIALSG